MTWVNEAAMTAALDAAARKAWELSCEERAKSYPPGTRFPDYDELLPMAKHRFAEQVMPIVWAALSALPDPRYAVWEEGYVAGVASPEADTNPYPSGLE